MRQQVHVRVRLGSGEAIEALVLEWLSYPDRALVQLPSRQRPSVVRLNPATGLYAPRSLPLPTPQLLTVLAGLMVGGTLLGFLVPTSPPDRPAASAPSAIPAIAPAPAATVPEEAPPQPPAPRFVVPAPRRAAPRPPAATRPPQAPPVPALAAAAPPPASTEDTRARPASPARYETKLTVLRADSARRGSHRCACGASFHTARELEAHRTGIVYSCIRYPKCQVTSTQPQAILEHYEQDRDTAGRCWREAVRLGGSYAVVKRPKCGTLAADPDRRKVIKVRVRLNTMDDDSPWR